MSTAPDTTTAGLKCQIRGCTLKKGQNTPVPLLHCSAPLCEKLAHSDCFSRVILKLDLPEIEIDGILQNVCTAKCYRVVKATVTGTSRAVWNKDGPGGPSDPLSSESVLIDWMTTEGNMRRYRGNHEGISKMQFANMIADKIAAAGIKVKRDPKSIVSKISAIEQSYKDARNWADNTGQGVLEEDDGEQKFWDKVKKDCPYFEELDPILKDRASVKPLATNEDIDKGDTDSNVGGDGSDSDDEDCEELSEGDVNEETEDEANEEIQQEESKEEETQEKSKQEEETKEEDGQVDGSPLKLSGKNKKSTTSTGSVSSSAGSSAKKKKIPRTGRGGSTAGRGGGSGGGSKMASFIANSNIDLLERLNARDAKKDTEWTTKEQEDNFKMNTIRRVHELRGMGMSDEDNAAIFPNAKDILPRLKNNN